MVSKLQTGESSVKKSHSGTKMIVMLELILSPQKYRSLHTPCDTEKHWVNFHIRLRLHSHCTKINSIYGG